MKGVLLLRLIKKAFAFCGIESHYYNHNIGYDLKPVESSSKILILKSSVFWDVTQCTPSKVIQHFGETCCPHFQCRRMSQARSQRCEHSNPAHILFLKHLIWCHFTTYAKSPKGFFPSIFRQIFCTNFTSHAYVLRLLSSDFPWLLGNNL
jgi:hypothetical protein